MPFPGPVSEKHALQLEYICISWAKLEANLSLLLVELVPLKGNADISNAVAGNLELRAKIQTLLAVGFVRKPSPQWFDHLRTMLLHIDNDLRPIRNRYVHDYWGWVERDNWPAPGFDPSAWTKMLCGALRLNMAEYSHGK